MEAVAYSKGVRVSTRKVRLVADAVRSLPVEKAIEQLEVMDKRGAYPLLKTLKSAVANAVSAKMDIKGLSIKSLQIDEASALKRFHASTRGRIHPYKRRGTHIRVILEGKAESAKNLQEKVVKGEISGK